MLPNPKMEPPIYQEEYDFTTSQALGEMHVNIGRRIPTYEDFCMLYSRCTDNMHDVKYLQAEKYIYARILLPSGVTPRDLSEYMFQMASPGEPSITTLLSKISPDTLVFLNDYFKNTFAVSLIMTHASTGHYTSEYIEFMVAVFNYYGRYHNVSHAVLNHFAGTYGIARTKVLAMICLVPTFKRSEEDILLELAQLDVSSQRFSGAHISVALYRRIKVRLSRRAYLTLSTNQLPRHCIICYRTTRNRGFVPLNPERTTCCDRPLHPKCVPIYEKCALCPSCRRDFSLNLKEAREYTDLEGHIRMIQGNAHLRTGDEGPEFVRLTNGSYTNLRYLKDGQNSFV